MTKRPLPFSATSRRTALLAAAVCLLYAAPLHAAPEYMSLAGINAKGFQKWIDEAHDKGFRPIYVNGFNAGDHAEFAGVAIKDDMNTPWEGKYDLTSEEYQTSLDQYTKKGFRPLSVSGYVGTGGAPRFAAVWGKDDGNWKWEARHNLSMKEYVETERQMRKEKLWPQILTCYADPEGGLRFTALFMRWHESDPDWDSRLDVTPDQFRDLMIDWHDRGFRAATISAYDTPDGPRFVLVAHKAFGPEAKRAWLAHANMSGEGYQKEFDRQGDDGYRPVAICGYRTKTGEARYNAIWFQYK